MTIDVTLSEFATAIGTAFKDTKAAAETATSVSQAADIKASTALDSTASIAGKVDAEVGDPADTNPPLFYGPSGSDRGQYVQIIGDPTDSVDGANPAPYFYMERTIDSAIDKAYPALLGGVVHVDNSDKAISGMRMAMINNGAHDCVGFSGRVRNNSDQGMACGVFGAAGIHSDTPRETMGLEGHIYENQAGRVTTLRDNSGLNWSTACHLYSDSEQTPAHFGMLINGNPSGGRYGFWSGIAIDGNSFIQDSDGSPANTVGLNMGGWSNDFHGEVAIKLGVVGTYHLERGNANLKVNSTDFRNINPTSHSRFLAEFANGSFGGFRAIRIGGVGSAAFLTWDGAGCMIGTDEDAPVVFHTDGAERMRISATGQVQVRQGGFVVRGLGQSELLKVTDNGIEGTMVQAMKVGPVTQASGLPTGAIMNSGSNANGRWIKYADGTLVCEKSGFDSVANGPAIWTFPMAFDTFPTVIPTAHYSNGPRSAGVDNKTATTVEVYSWDATGDESVLPKVDLYAIGRWHNE